MVKDMQKRYRQRKLLIATGGLVAILLAVAAAAVVTSKKTLVQSHSSYILNVTSGASYPASQPSSLIFDIRDQNGNVLKDFDVVHEKQLHTIVVRKDLKYFQHVHPAYDKASGKFTLADFRFPTDGEYRVFADFTPSDSQKGPDGRKLTATPYKDVKAGDVSKYAAQPIGNDKLESSANGLDTHIYFPPSDDSPGSTPNKDFYAGQPSYISVAVNKNDQPYKNLQTYLGALGHMVVLGTNLEYIHAHATSQDVAGQVGLVTFEVTFPREGQYKLYLQTQADGQVNTTDYTLTVKPNPGVGSQESKPTPGMHGGH